MSALTNVISSRLEDNNFNPGMQHKKCIIPFLPYLSPFYHIMKITNSYTTFTVQSSEINKLGFRIVSTDEPRPLRK